MKKLPEIPFGIAIFVALTVVALVCLAILMLASGSFGQVEVAWHLATGFVYFLKENVAKISTDAGTWGPGLTAFLLGLGIIHWFGRLHARHRQQAWKISTTFAIGMLLPLLFAISFLVPGVFLQVQQLANTPWLARDAGGRAFFKNEMQILGLRLADAAADSERYPDSLEDLLERKLVTMEDLFPHGQYAGKPREPMLYLGKGLTLSSDPSLPLLISPPYSSNREIKRMILTAGHKLSEIPDSDLDVWIERSMTAADAAKP